MKNILVAVTGASPQVLTETLYGLHTQGKAFPDEMYVITTQDSKEMLMDGLYTRGHLQALYDEYQLPAVKFDESHIWVIEDEDGNLLHDAKREEDQSVMADFITRKVAWLTEQDDCVIHASIAGGRKTMAFYMGYAMSLLGREQDTLSHVFVNDEFEFVRDFYFPTLKDNWITGKKPGETLNTKDAEITFAEIPFVRMRKSLSNDLIGQIDQASFSKTVAKMNAANQKLSVKVSMNAKTLSVLGIDIKLTPKEIAFYQWLLQQPNRSILADRVFTDNKQHSINYLDIYTQVGDDPRVLTGTFGIENTIAWKEGDIAMLKTMEVEFIQPIRSSVNSKLKNALPIDVLEKVKIQSKKQKGIATYWIEPELILICD
ncbi:CRISPR-associated ring nuclease Csm6 [Moritella sp. Urea-trap-13]|uniref:CRISPR-associated ring nuclease Csm6 n=1 Tax=Moritella sp. Urea-trap-13 TaxID=2058327 RepID=UPI000C33BEF9|nr:CRISPR-associated ring nuclease Csm6 [Moritella sp. Urea-trap-13]PKH07117.1 TIGR02584 family CRISPR-associated protein [Moritella sp. Urea-trap-13]